MPTVSAELRELARLLADWAVPAPNTTLYLFGSRVRGDYGPTSDVDLCVDFGKHPDTADVHWWTINSAKDFAAIKPLLPGPLKILERQDDWWWRVVSAQVVHQDRNVRCIWLEPKPQR